MIDVEFAAVREDTGKIVSGYYVVLKNHGKDEHKDLHVIIDRCGQYNRVIPETVELTMLQKTDKEGKHERNES